MLIFNVHLNGNAGYSEDVLTNNIYQKMVVIIY